MNRKSQTLFITCFIVLSLGVFSKSQSVSAQVITNSIGMEMRLISAGSFTMGSSEGELYRDNDEGPARVVSITNPFYLGVREVTQGQWEEVMGTTPWLNQSYVRDGADYPASYVSWQSAQEFCQELSALDEKTYRLPTEAEWEYACRAGATTAYSFGSTSVPLGNHAWYRLNADDLNQAYAHYVGQKQSNAWGLYDMHGNVWEWCQDWYGSYYDGASTTNPTGAVSGEFRVYRGGSWDCNPWSCRSAFRNRRAPAERGYNLGFRVVGSVE